MSGLATFRFDPSVIKTAGNGRVSLNGPTVYAWNIQVDGYPLVDPEDGCTYPVYFEVTGWLHHYVVRISAIEAILEVCDPWSLERRSTMRPRNQSELLEALDTIGADFEEFLDIVSAA